MTNLYLNTVSPLLWEIIQELFSWKELQDFRLAGGTALNLQLGHRKSADIDLFTGITYGKADIAGITRRLKRQFDYYDSSGIENNVGLSCFLGRSSRDCIKLDIYYTDPFAFPCLQFQNIRIASLEDIILMKLDILAGSQGGRKKDFWDIHELLDKFTIKEMLALYSSHVVGGLPAAELLERIVYFDHAEHDFEPICLRGKYWELIKIDLEEEVVRLKLEDPQMTFLNTSKSR